MKYNLHGILWKTEIGCSGHNNLNKPVLITDISQNFIRFNNDEMHLGHMGPIWAVDGRV